MEKPDQPTDTGTPEEVDVPSGTESVDEGFVPKGTMVFALVLIAGYAIYFFLIWYEIVVARGGA